MLGISGTFTDHNHFNGFSQSAIPNHTALQTTRILPHTSAAMMFFRLAT
jgi:hypothetical protein